MSYYESQYQRPAEQYAGQRTRSVLRLLNNDPNVALDHPELREEFLRLFQLLQRIEELAEEEIMTVIPIHEFPDPEPEQDVPMYASAPEPELEPELSPDLVAFDPSEFSRSTREDESTPDSAVSEQGDDDTNPENSAEAMSDAGPHAPNGQEEQTVRWWVNFNGDISLERLAALRSMLTESPFTLEAQFDEITDGLIVLRVVTDHHLKIDQIDWLIRNVMQQVGMDRNAAIVSGN